MYSTIPRQWRSGFKNNVTIEELNDTLVQLHIPAIALIAVLMCAGLFGNIVVLCIYTNYKASTYKSFIVWLGWMDLLACLVGKPALIISMLYPYMSPSEILCRWSRFLHVFVSVSAALIFLAISYERYKKICFMDTHQLSYKRVNIICLLAAISAFVVAIPALFVFGNASVETGVYNISGVECFIDQTYKVSYFPKLYFLFQLLLCLLSFSMMCVFYIRIWKTLRWHRTFVHDHTYKPNARKCTVSELKGNKRTNVSVNDILLDNLKKAEDKATSISELKGNKRTNVSVNDILLDNLKKAEDKATSISELKGNKRTNVSVNDILLDNLKKAEDKATSSEFANLETEYEHEQEPGGAANPSNSFDMSVSGKSTVQTSRKSLSKSQRNLLSVQVNETFQQAQKHTKEITKMLFIVTVVFILSFLPHLVLMVMNSIRPQSLKNMSPAGVVLYTIFLRTFVINNMANPIVYFLCLGSFRSMCLERFSALVGCLKNKDK